LFAFSGNFHIERPVNTHKEKADRLNASALSQGQSSRSFTLLVRIIYIKLKKLSQRQNSRSLILMLFNAVTGRQISRSLALELLAAYLSAPQEAS